MKVLANSDHWNHGSPGIYWFLDLLVESSLLMCLNKIMIKKMENCIHVVFPECNFLSCEVMHWPKLEVTLLTCSQNLSPRAARLWLLFRPSLIHFLLGLSCRNFATLARATGSIKQRRKELHSHLPRPSLANLAAQFCCPNPIFSLDRKPLLETAGGETQNLYIH